MVTKVDKSVSSTPGIADSSNATAITIDSSENVGIGETTPLGKVHIKSGDSGASSVSGDKDELVIENNSHAGITTLATDSTESGMFFGHTSDTRAGEIFTRYDTTTMTIGTRMSGGLVKFIYDNGSEAMRIDASGNFMVGQTSLNYNVVGGSIASNGLIRGASTGQVTAFNRKGSDGEITVFYKDGVSVGSISTNGSSLPSSDRNFKRDISDLDLGLDLVNKLKPSQFRFKVSDEDSPLIYGLIAQDLEESLTEEGIEKNSAWLLQHNPKEDVNESDYSLDYTALIPILINSIQELSAKVEELESKINE